jgi:hypothetical protein
MRAGDRPQAEGEMLERVAAEPAERTYKRAVDFAKRSYECLYRHDAAHMPASVRDGARLKGRITLREFSERLALSRSKSEA